MHMRSIWFGFLIAACSGGAQNVAIGPPPPKQSTGSFAGPLCDYNGVCKCKEDGQDPGVPDNPAHKRFELRLGPSAQELWATVHGNVLYKSGEKAEECWYVDLPTGDVPIELRASSPGGVSAAWSIAELGTQTKSWYDTFRFNCGSPGVCAFDDLDNFKREFNALPNRVRDQCGSVKIKGVTWDTGKSPDAMHPDELAVHVHLEVYKRAPDKPHGDASCGKPAK